MVIVERSRFWRWRACALLGEKEADVDGRRSIVIGFVEREVCMERRGKVGDACWEDNLKAVELRPGHS